VFVRRWFFLPLLIAAVMFGPPDAAAVRKTSRVRHARHAHHYRHIVWNPMFKGSHEMLVRENEVIDQLQLPRIADDDELIRLEESDALVPLHESESLVIAPNLIPTRRYCRPWTRDFLQDFAAAYYERFHRPLQVNSLVRTVQQQKRLRRHNRNAGPVTGDTASTHLTGVAVDLSRRGLTRVQRKWIDEYLLPLKEEGLVEPIEERREPVYHIVVYDKYTGWRDTRNAVMESMGTE